VPHEHFERAVRSAKVLPQGVDIRRDFHLHQEPGIIAGRDHVAEYLLLHLSVLSSTAAKLGIGENHL
jgi:hypothetical protein